jgi:rSAM/selenodomain-associated transferase 1
LVITRAPIPGFAKTRLGAAIGMEKAAQLHTAFLTDIASKFFDSKVLPETIDRGWAFTPETYEFPGLIGQLGAARPVAEMIFVEQVGSGLGERLTNCFSWAHEQGYQATVIMASDSPQLDPAIIVEAFSVLKTHDLVIGRVLDGGYYLVGQRGFSDVLSHVPMSTASAADALVETATGRGLTVGELPHDLDVDVEEDLWSLFHRLQPDGKDAPATFAAIRKLFF